jgi:transglutaminase-like putative cysteine protease
VFRCCDRLAGLSLEHHTLEPVAMANRTDPGTARWRLAGISCVVIASATPAPVTAQAYEIGPPGSWIQRHAFDVDAVAPADREDNAFYFLLYDRQARVDSTIERFSRRVVRLLSPAGTDAASRISAQFDPAYERLRLHEISIWRDGRRIDALPRASIRVLHRETDLEARLYDGRLTADVVLEGLRVGDVVDYSFTVRGHNPVFQGRYDGGFPAEFTIPIARVRQRLLWPQGRTLHVRPLGRAQELQTQAQGRYVEYRLDLDAVAAVEQDDDVPAWFEDFAWIQLSEWRNWGDVVEWALPLYTPDTAAVARQAAAVASSTADRAGQVVAALRFVQDEVRYLAYAMGEGSHEPRPPRRTLDRRFGDCKDKSLLLISLLHALGMEAHAALVHTDGISHRSDRWPTPLAFDHVIVLLHLDGERYWLDPALTEQRGNLLHLHQPDYGHALVVRPGVTSLVAMTPPRPRTPDHEVEEEFDLTAGTDARLTVRTVFRGTAADPMRSRLARTPLTEIARDYLNYYARSYPGIEIDGELTVHDDEQHNTLTFHERYLIRDVWRVDDESGRGTLEVRAGDIDSALRWPRIRQRTTPLATGGRRRVRQTITMLLPHTWNISAERTVLEGDVLRYSSSVSYAGDTLTLLYDLEITADDVMPDQARNYLADLDRIDRDTYYQLWQGGESSGGISWPLVLVMLAAAAAAARAAVAAYRYEPAHVPAPVMRSNPALTGIGGWLLLLAITILIDPIVWLGSVVSNIVDIDADAFRSLTVPGAEAYHPMWAPALAFEIALGTFIGLVGIALFVLLLRRRTTFPLWCQVYLVCVTAGAVLLTGFTSSIPAAREEADVTNVFLAVALNLAWIAYCRTSVRVRNTFTRPRDPAAGQVGEMPQAPLKARV